MEKMTVPLTERFPLLAMDREAVFTVQDAGVHDTGDFCRLEDKPTGPFRAEVTTIDNEVWCTNALRFPDKEEALEYAANLARRWMLVTRWRVVQESVAENQPYEPGSEDGAW
jgi:hypothetical protein